MKPFLRPYLLFCLLTGAILYALYSQFGPRVIHPFTPYTFAFFAILTFLTYRVTARLVQANPDNFMVAYFGTMVVRLLLSLTLVLVYLFRGGGKEGDARWAFLGSFFILYFLFAGFEVWSVLSNLRPFSKPGENTK
ncbi:hypothetical protein MUN84_13600 [Hymenobacter sp. 5516J-16]|uniref:Uncharacterized protein n=1 Tax=Hymenobacter sublimis TaxID=2933777 RepID=A0ABY4JDD6_9BACT|nr:MULTISPECIES: hypothetical protein [Hymenobacter]UOQ75692.1 hypothetical protein MUN84_13600 [Hymenobacter sp. 5516J-16]UPL49364.1 hypothetical protein MWH26_00255 [Hymenobacter sublimis]